MIQVIMGLKGSGKTKKLIDSINESVARAQGDVVCIEKGAKRRFDIKPTARLIDTEEYMIADAQALYGFVAGILASNHDVTDLFIDSTLKICKEDFAAFEQLVVELNKLVEKIDVNMVMTVSMPEDKITDTIRPFI